MNHSPDSEREWQLQEQALQAERSGGDAGSARLQQYRLLARVLAEPMAVGLPPDFAREIARRVERERLLDGHIERRMLAISLGVFGLIGLLCLIAQGEVWLGRLFDLVPALSGLGGDWSLLALACLAAVYLPGMLTSRPLHLQAGVD